MKIIEQKKKQKKVSKITLEVKFIGDNQNSYKKNKGKQKHKITEQKLESNKNVTWFKTIAYRNFGLLKLKRSHDKAGTAQTQTHTHIPHVKQQETQQFSFP